MASDLRELLAQEVGKSGRDIQHAIIERIVQKALAGDLKAVNVILDILGERAPTKQQVNGVVDIAEALKRARERIQAAERERGRPL